MNTDIRRAFEKYLAEVRRRKPSTIEVYCHEVGSFFKWRAENAQEGPIEEIQQGRLEDYLNACRNRGNSFKALAGKRSALLAFFDYAVWAHIRPDNPGAGIELPGTENDLNAVFSRDDVLRLFNACDVKKEVGLRDSVMLALAAFAGLGSGDISRLRIEQIEDKGNRVDIAIAPIKGKLRRVPLWPAPSLLIKDMVISRLAQGARKGDTLLVSHRGNRLAARDLARILKVIAKRAKMRRPQLTILMLRNTCVVSCRSVRGFDAAKIKARMGWRSTSPLNTHVFREREVLQRYRSLEGYWIDFERWLRNAHHAG